MQIIRIGLFIVLVTGMGVTGFAKGDSFAKKEVARQKKLIRPELITVGPFDNYQVSLDEVNQVLYFTKDVDLAHHIYKQSLGNGASESLFPLKHDSDSPVLSPDGKWLAFVYFERDALGDICLFELKNSVMNCIPDTATKDRYPFWLNAHTVGFVSTSPFANQSELVLYNVLTKQKNVLFHDANIFNPDADEHQDWVIYSTSERTLDSTQSSRFVLYEKKTGRRLVLKIPLPGISSFPRFDATGTYLYFSQYLNDTNQDQVIDANDHSVIFRIPTKELSDEEHFSTALTPEQLTSGDQSCSYANPSPSGLYVTCAADNTLNVYRLPLSGMIPGDWGIEDLWDAHRTSRGFAERLLILNRLERLGEQPSQVREKIFSNYVSMNAYNSALFALARLSETEERKLMRLILETLRLQALVLRQAFLDADRNKLIDIQKDLETRFAKSPLQLLAKGFVSLALKQKTDALTYYKKVKFSALSNSFQLYFYDRLRNQLMEAGLALSLDEKLDYLLALADHPLLNEAQQTYFVSLFYEQLDSTFPELKKKRQWLQGNEARMPSAPLLQKVRTVEFLRYDLIESDEAHRQDAYKSLFKAIHADRKNYYLTRLFLVRLIRTLSRHEKWQYMYYFAKLWFSSTLEKDTEYAYARDQYIYTSLDKAYGYFDQKNHDFARDEFYIAARLTDHLEAYFGYVKTMMIKKEQDKIKTTLDDLKKEGYVGDNLEIVNVLLSLLGSLSPLTEKEVDTHIKTLETIQKLDADHALRFLLLGYLYQTKLGFVERNSPPYQALASSAHRYLMISYDLSRDNARIAAVALRHLGFLHLTIENYGQAVSFLSLRAESPYETVSEALDLAWLLAKAHYFNRTPEKAADIIAKALENSDFPENEKPAFAERHAFYLLAAKDFKQAEHHYQSLIDQGLDAYSPDLKIKIQLNTLISKTKNEPDRNLLSQFLALSEQIEKNSELTLYRPRYQFLIAGFMAQQQSATAVDKIRYLKTRLQILKSEDDPRRLGLNADDVLRYQQMARNQIAFWEFELGNDTAGRQMMKAAIEAAKTLLTEKKNPLDPGVESTLHAALQRCLSAYRTLNCGFDATLFQLADDYQTQVTLLFGEDKQPSHYRLEFLWIMVRSFVLQPGHALFLDKKEYKERIAAIKNQLTKIKANASAAVIREEVLGLEATMEYWGTLVRAE